MQPDFWNARYRGAALAYGASPNAFLARQGARYLPSPSDVVELGAGEGRNAVYLARQGHRVTAVDYAAVGLEKARRLAAAHGVTLEAIEADVTAWDPGRRWDAVVIAFLHLPPDQRPALYGFVQEVLRPGGLLLAQWFRPEQVSAGYESGGPKSAAMMVALAELRGYFDPNGFLLAEETEAVLEEGPFHRGPAAVVQVVWRRVPPELPNR